MTPVGQATARVEELRAALEGPRTEVDRLRARHAEAAAIADEAAAAYKSEPGEAAWRTVASSRDQRDRAALDLEAAQDKLTAAERDVESAEQAVRQAEADADRDYLARVDQVVGIAERDLVRHYAGAIRALANATAALEERNVAMIAAQQSAEYALPDDVRANPRRQVAEVRRMLPADIVDHFARLFRATVDAIGAPVMFGHTAAEHLLAAAPRGSAVFPAFRAIVTDALSEPTPDRPPTAAEDGPTDAPAAATDAAA